MITLYDARETDFSHNGLGIVNAVSAIVTEELNGMYELAFECVAQDSGNTTWKRIDNFSIVKAETPRGLQLFRVYRVKKDMRYRVTVNAWHICYDGLYNFVEYLNLSGVTGANAFMQLYNNTQYPHCFQVGSDVANTGDFEIQDANPVSAVMDSGGIVDTFGGELLRDNFNISLLARIGAEKGFTIRYRKNLSGLDMELVTDNTATRIRPIARNSKNDPLYLPEKYIDSPNIGAYFNPLIFAVSYSDLRVGQDGLTTSQVYEEMRQRVAELYQAGADLPKLNAKVDFVLLRDTAEYKEYALLEDVALGDTVAVVHEKLGVSLKSECIKYTYDCISKRYLSIELGEFRENLSKTISREVSRSAGGGKAYSANDFETIYNMIAEQAEKLASHAHTGNDGTRQISRQHLID